MGRKGLTGKTRAGVLLRLAAHVEARFRTWRVFEQETGVAHATADEWRLGRSVPDLPALVQLAKTDPSLDLNWLLVNRRPPGGWVREEEVDQLIKTVARGALWRLKQEQRKRSPKRRRSRGTHGRRKS